MRIIRYFLSVVGAWFLIIYIALLCNFTYEYAPNNEHIHEIYNRVLAATGQTQEAVPLVIEKNSTMNAYTDGQRVVIFTGIIKYAKDDDEIALILGHELAHVMLHHPDDPDVSIYNTVIHEALADKLGAYYAMRAGYSVCTGREIWKRLYITEGDYLGLDHPSYSYRYDQLDVQCEAL